MFIPRWLSCALLQQQTYLPCELSIYCSEKYGIQHFTQVRNKPATVRMVKSLTSIRTRSEKNDEFLRSLSHFTANSPERLWTKSYFANVTAFFIKPYVQVAPSKLRSVDSYLVLAFLLKWKLVRFLLDWLSILERSFYLRKLSLIRHLFFGFKGWPKTQVHTLVLIHVSECDSSRDNKLVIISFALNVGIE